jgi:hypothetical protein
MFAMLVSYFFNFLGSLFEYMLLFLASFVKINMIWGGCSAHVTALQGALPCFIGFNFFTFFYFFLYSFKGAMIVFKLPSILGGFCFYGLRSQRNLRTIFLGISLIFFILSFVFIFYFKKTFIYTLFWLGAGSFLLFRKEKQISLFESSFISIWFAHASGTLIYGIFCGFLTNSQYVTLFPIAICERIILTFILCLSFIGRIYIGYFFDKIKLIYVKKFINNEKRNSYFRL